MSDSKSDSKAKKSSKSSDMGLFGSIKGTPLGDLVGLLIAVAAVALLISLYVPSTAPVTVGMRDCLTTCFGTGAFLFPLALFVFAMGFFIDGYVLVSGRFALGLTLIVLALLSLISLNAEGVEANPSLVFDPLYLANHGGYVGGAFAYLLLTGFGRWVGVSILVGVIFAGSVVCGFSISSALTKVRHTASSVASNYRDAAYERRERRAKRAAEETSSTDGLSVLSWSKDDEQEGEKPELPPAETQTKMPFLGLRKTTVLKRKKDGEKDTAPVDETMQIAKPVSLDEALREMESKDAKASEQDALFSLTDAEEEAYASLSNLSSDSSDGNQAKAQNAKSLVKKTKSVPHPKVAKQLLKKAERPGEEDADYELPPFDMLSSNPNSASSASSREELDETMRRLQSTLAEFGLTSKVVDYTSGPLVTTFQVEMGEGERVNKITNLQDDIALSLAAKSVRIFAPIPGTSRVGIEIPNKTRQNVHLGDVLPYATGGPLEFAIGRDAEGRPVTANLATMPHLLVAGATGSGKSVMINSLIMSLLMRDTPKQVRLILVDPKRVEFAGYNGLPHLYVPVVTEPRQAASALQWSVSEMERRLKVFERAAARNINVYNEMCVSGKLSEMDNPPEPMPYMVIIIDELADLMMVAGKDVEASIVRIAQLARAAGIHLVLATQRPSANVVTGLIKSNIETRIALSVASGTDSRVIIDQVGAQRLLGNGDMLFKERGGSPLSAPCARVLCLRSGNRGSRRLHSWPG